jgi:hypothetical protein
MERSRGSSLIASIALCHRASVPSYVFQSGLFIGAANGRTEPFFERVMFLSQGRDIHAAEGLDPAYRGFAFSRIRFPVTFAPRLDSR